ncbi:MAG: modification enzyme MiaB family [Bacteriovoracaceae bacterium]|nr:modification enzyme MiaB family [Bacteriovoracaceae bacterium]
MRRVYIQTYGCQMNEYDTAQMLQILALKGFEKVQSAEAADLILINSCSVREKSEVKALSILGRYAQLKQKDPQKVIGFGGCVGQTEGAKLVKKYPFLDFSFGTNNYRDLPEMLKPFEDRFGNEDETEILLPSSKPEAKSQAFITITNGCDKFCSYCIVPFTRGREVSRSPEEIIREAAALVQKGVREIMLLGQNVNSYWGKNKFGSFTSLFQLLQLFQDESEKSLKGLVRLRYTTSHPRDFDEDLARAHRDLPILCEYLHLPFQSGSDQVLRKMRRFYTADTYLKKMEMVKKYRPDIALSTDVIVGFPGESRKDFEDTLKVMREVEFDNVYAFNYSPRPYTRSADWEDDVSLEEKSDRIQELITLQRATSLKKYQEDIGQTVEIMLEGPSKNNSLYWTGRTRKNRVVHIPTQNDFQMGQLFEAEILEATNSWQRGVLKMPPVRALA